MPSTPTDLRDMLKARVAKYLADPRSMRPAPPWIYPLLFSDPEDGEVLAAVHAVHMVAPTAIHGPEPWLIRGTLRAANGGLVLSRLTVEHLNDPDIEVTGVVLHRIPVARLRDFAASYLAMAPIVADALEIQSEPPDHPDAEAIVKQRKQAATKRKRWAQQVSRHAKTQPLRRGRKGYPTDHYRRIALLAIEIHDEGRRDVIKEIATRERIPYQTARDWIRRARELEFLGTTKQGRSHWAAGPQLYRKEEDSDGK